MKNKHNMTIESILFIILLIFSIILIVLSIRKIDYCENKKYDMYCEYKRYDVNQDGKINAQDYVAIKNFIMERNYYEK